MPKYPKHAKDLRDIASYHYEAKIETEIQHATLGGSFHNTLRYGAPEGLPFLLYALRQPSR